MPASDLPVEGTAEDSALSFNDGADAIENLLDDSGEPKPVKKVEAKEEAEQPEETDEVEADDDADAPEDEEATEEPDGSEPLKGGRFAPDTAKVTLEDGTVITVAELKRNNLFQRDYTRKTTELKQERDTFSQYQEQMGKVAQSLAQQRDFVLSVAQRFVPKAPDRGMLDPASPSFDPIAYTQQKADYDEHMQVLNQLNYQQQAERGRMTEEQKIEANQRKAQEWERLSTAVPEFKDSKVYTKFWNDAVETMAAYGFAEQELSETIDHRMYLAMRDLVQFRRARQQAPKVKQEIENKPRIMPGGRRMDPKAKTTREAQQRSEALRKSGTFDAGIASLMDLKDL
jgi:hypothetical protein